jgi:hypothetical protein
MTKRQEDKLGMYKAVLSHNEQNARVVETIPALQGAYTAFKSVVAGITDTMQQQADVVSGYTSEKQQQKATLCTMANEIAATLYAWAVEKDDLVVKAKTKTSLTVLLELREEELIPVCRNYHSLLVEKEAQLADYGITTAGITRFKEAIDNYATALPLPRNKRALKSTFRMRLDELFQKADRILKERIDKLSLPLRKDNPDFADAYKFNRAIVNSATSRTALRILVKEDKTKQALPDVHISIGEIEFTAQTDAKGEALAKPIPQGTYTLSIQKAGWEAQTLSDVRIKQGKSNTTEVFLKKTG